MYNVNNICMFLYNCICNVYLILKTYLYSRVNSKMYMLHGTVYNMYTYVHILHSIRIVKNTFYMSIQSNTHSYNILT